MNDISDIYQILREEQRTAGIHNRQIAARDFFTARDYGRINRLAELKQCSEVHYQFKLPSGALLNFYPGNQRLYWDRNKPLGPYLKLPEGVENWTLMMVMQAIERAM